MARPRREYFLAFAVCELTRTNKCETFLTRSSMLIYTYAHTHTHTHTDARIQLSAIESLHKVMRTIGSLCEIMRVFLSVGLSAARQTIWM